MDGDMGDCQKDELDEFANDEEIFKPRKKRVSEFKTLPWPKQMYAIQRYLESGMYPYFMFGSAFRNTRRDFRWVVKDHYIMDKERQVLRKIVNLRKREDGKFDSECEFLTFSLLYQIVWLLV